MFEVDLKDSNMGIIDENDNKRKTDSDEAKNEPRCLKPLLKQILGNYLCILNCNIEDLVPLGENFASSILKITVRIQRSKTSCIEELHLVGKMILTDNPYFNWTKVLKKEVFMYTDIIPTYESIEIMKDVDSRKTVDSFLPKFYGYRLSLDPNIDEADEDAIILLENVKMQGYYVLDRNKGLDLKHAIAALRALAKFHAFGIVVRNKNTSAFEKIKAQAVEFAYNDISDWSFINDMIRLIKSHPEFSRYGERFEELVNVFKMKDRYELVRHSVWSTVIHNDYWTNNIMFHANEAGDIDGLKFIDFQVYNYANLFVDLPYFLCSSLADDVILRDFDYLLDVYYEAFVEVLKTNDIDIKQFSRDKFDNQLKKDASFELVHCNIGLCFFTTEIDKDVKDRNDLLGKILAFKGNENYFRKLKMIFELYERKEWLYS